MHNSEAGSPTIATLTNSGEKSIFVISKWQLHLSLVLLILIFGFISHEVSILLGVLFAAYLLFRAKPDCVFALLLLYISHVDFGDFSQMSENMSAVAAGQAQSPWDVQLAVNLLLPLCVVWELIRNPTTFRGKVKPLFFGIWFLAFIPTVMGTVLGHEAGYGMWTRGLRFLMMVSAYYYGIILSRHWKEPDWPRLVKSITIVTIVLMVLAGARVFNSHMVFLLTGAGTSLAAYYFRKRTKTAISIGVLLLFTVLYFAFNATFTVMLIALMAILFDTLATRKYPLIRKYLLRIVGIGTVVAVLSFVVIIAGFGDKLNVDTTFSYKENQKISSRLQEKIFADRMRFWIAAYNQIAEGPYFIVPSGRPLLVIGMNKEWTSGSHNTILETLRLTGLFSGGIILFMLFVILRKTYQVIMYSKSEILKLFAVTALSVAVAGIVTGDYPLDNRTGFWIWAFAGLAYGNFLSENVRRLNYVQ